MKVVSAAEMRAIEVKSVELGVSLEQLQLNAARAIAEHVERIAGGQTGTLLFLAGRGNNGRDALIAASILRDRGFDVAAYLAPSAGSEDLTRRLRGAGAQVVEEQGKLDRTILRELIRDSVAVIDGLLGIGIRGEVREPIAGLIGAAAESCRESGVPVIAVDLPSGVDADTGDIAGVALPADFTVSLGCVKAGLLRFPAADLTGLLATADIGLPVGSLDGISTELLMEEEVAGLLPPRPANSHKGSFGRVLVVAGSSRYVGAGYLVGAAAARSGCGLLTLAVPEWQRTALASLLPEATYLPLASSERPEDVEANVRSLEELMPVCDVLAVGPGLGVGPGARRLVAGVLDANARGPRLPCVIDADGLDTLAGHGQWWEPLGASCVLTPHPGELGRMLGLTATEVNARRWDLARESAARSGQTVLLKGPFSVVADAGGRSWINPFALSALASGGTGDVLTGIIAGLIAQGASPAEAARAGMFVHGAAAEDVLDEGRTDRLLASDLLPAIPRILARISSAWE